VGLGALLVGRREGDELVFTGKVGTGFDTAQLTVLRAQLDQLEVAATPFTRAVGLPRSGAHWVRPVLVVPVAFIEWTRNGKLRHPRFVGLPRPAAPGEGDAS
jgi:ATP-dependent DNA ligase